MILTLKKISLTDQLKFKTFVEMMVKRNVTVWSKWRSFPLPNNTITYIICWSVTDTKQFINNLPFMSLELVSINSKSVGPSSIWLTFCSKNTTELTKAFMLSCYSSCLQIFTVQSTRNLPAAKKLQSLV